MESEERAVIKLRLIVNCIIVIWVLTPWLIFTTDISYPDKMFAICPAGLLNVFLIYVIGTW